MLIKWGLWCAFLDWHESVSCMGMRVLEIRRKMREKCHFAGWSQRDVCQTQQGYSHKDASRLKCLTLKFPSWAADLLNYTSKPSEWRMFGPLAPTPEGLPVRTREIFYSPRCSWLPAAGSACCVTHVGRGVQWVQVAFSSGRVSPLIF